ncbi:MULTISPECIES: LytR C-terminal domain-containing protein [Actinoplanes]|uniref:LytR C-terminal domain-containing protein n=1 Tax=Actinoplanes TaxID=1865 RepID=UPI0005F28651|nr:MULTISPECIES: LytR C-terminal domain-containing protein [Actinoplanes]GLY08152.1 hypothetical protein Acsp01_85310 [Actinoplanes sp. NBRC 101535]
MRLSRVRAYATVGVLAVAAGVVAGVAVAGDSQGTAATACPDSAPRVNLTLPEEESQVTIRVLNGSGVAGTAGRVTEDFKNRGFKTEKPKEKTKKSAEVAVIRYGPSSVSAAHWLRAYFLGAAVQEYSAERTSGTVEIVIGEKYQQLATKTEVNQSLAQLSAPTLPPGACAVAAGR